MKVKSIEMDEEGLPEFVTVHMSRDEALVITRVLGGMNGIQHAAKGTNHEAASEVYDCLTGDLFNRFWDDGERDLPRV